MDIAFINRWGRGGGVIWDIQMAKYLEDLGVNVTFHIGKSRDGNFKHPPDSLPSYKAYTMPDFPDYAKAAPRGISGGIKDFDTYLFERRVDAAINYANYDIIHVTGLVSFHKRVNETPTVIKLCGPPHSLWLDVMDPFTSSYDRLSGFDSIIATGITTEQVEAETNCTVTTINPGVDTTTFRPDRRTSENLTITWAGRFAPSKDLELLVRSFADIHRDNPDTELLLVGDGPLKKRIEKLVTSLGVASSVKMPGYVAHHEMADYYQISDIFALSSKHESFGMVILEAMSCGLPVVAPKVGWIPNIVEHGVNGLLYEAGSQEGLKSNMRRVTDDHSLRNRLDLNARKTIRGSYDWNSRAESLEAVYNELI